MKIKDNTDTIAFMERVKRMGRRWVKVGKDRLVGVDYAIKCARDRRNIVFPAWVVLGHKDPARCGKW